MNYKKIALILLVAIITILIILFLVKPSKEHYFKQIELPTSNTILNSLGRLQYYDTILAVGLDGVGLNGITVTINNLSDAAINQFNGELKAHIRYYNGTYYLFIKQLNRSEAIQVIAHEIVHIQQYYSGEMIYENGEIKWQGKDYTFALQDDYEKRPWEKDAFSKQTAIETVIHNKLY